MTSAIPSRDGISSVSRSKGCSANDVCNANKAIPSEHSVATIKGAEDTKGSTGDPDARRLAKEGFRCAAEEDADADGTQGRTRTTMAETIAVTNNIRLVQNEVILLYCCYSCFVRLTVLLFTRVLVMESATTF